MKLGPRIFLCYLAIFSVCLYYPIYRTLTTLRVGYLEGVEEPLVDQANILASLVGLEVAEGSFDPARLGEVFAGAHGRKLRVQVYSLLKTSVDTQVYVTDASGTVIFDSRTPSAVGENYLKWRDVRLTLTGEYGARSTRTDPADPGSSVLHVAAPVVVDGRIAGSVTVAKPTASINAFIRQARPQVIAVGLLSLGAAALLSLALSYWLTRPIRRLIDYVNGIRENRRPPFPRLGNSEIADLGEALRKMQEALEGKRYVEEYVQNLTHEIKSPLSAIRGAAELLGEEMPPEARTRFLANIREESARISRIVDAMLELAALENRRMQPEMEAIEVAALIRGVLESRHSALSRKRIAVAMEQPEEATVTGNLFLLHQALGNLLENAVEFSPAGGTIKVAMTVEKGNLIIAVEDEGPGVPEYALPRVFEKFYSLQRPDTGKKSTGLGLNFVREIAVLHGGSVELVNRPGGGAKGMLDLPLAKAEA